MASYDYLNRFYIFYKAVVVGMISRHGLGLMHIIETNIIRVS